MALLLKYNNGVVCGNSYKHRNSSGSVEFFAGKRRAAFKYPGKHNPLIMHCSFIKDISLKKNITKKLLIYYFQSKIFFLLTLNFLFEN